MKPARFFESAVSGATPRAASASKGAPLSLQESGTRHRGWMRKFPIDKRERSITQKIWTVDFTARR